MNIYKRIISLFVAFAMCISLMVVPASANALVPAGGYLVSNFTKSVALGAILSESFGFMECSGEYLSTLWDAMNTGVCDGCEVNPNGQHDFMPTDILVTSWEAALRGSEACDCRYCGISYDEFWDSTYNQYVSAIQNDLGTTTIADGGFYLYANVIGVNFGTSTIPPFTVGRTVSFGPYKFNNSFCQVEYAPLKAPVAGYYTYFREFSSTNVSIQTSGEWVNSTSGRYGIPCQTRTSANKGKTLISADYPYVKFKLSTADFAYLSYSCGWYVEPLDGVLPTTQNININSRPTSIVGDYGIIGDDGTIIKVDGNMIVDESTSTVFNPVTNVTNNYTDYAFDYSDRSYNLTLEDGSTLKVVYGDENVTIHEGDTIYNIYYLIPDDSGSGGGSDSGDTPSGEDMSWWKQAWTSFTDKLFSILGNGGSSVNPDTAPAVPDDEETGEKGYSVIDLFVVLKDGTWAFITGIVSTAYDGFTGFVESVSSAGSFFTFYDEESEDGILFVPLEGGETIWD